MVTRVQAAVRAKPNVESPLEDTAAAVFEPGDQLKADIARLAELQDDLCGPRSPAEASR